MITHPQVPGQCTRVPARRARARAGPGGELDGRGGARGGGGRASAGRRRSGRCSRRSDLRRHGPPRAGRGSRGQRNALRVAGAAARGGRAGRAPPLRPRDGGEWKTSLVFWGAGAERPGWLVRCLDEFARRDINLTKIESRPRRERPRQLHVLRRPRRPRRGPAGRRGDRADRRRAARRCCVLGSYAAAAEPWLAASRATPCASRTVRA